MSALLAQPQESLPDLFRFEWQKADLGNPVLRLSLAIIAHDKHPKTLSQLAQLTNSDLEEITRLVAGLSFIKTDLVSHYLTFVTEAFRRFGAKELSSMETRVTELLIDFLLCDQDSDKALTALPDYLERAGRFTVSVRGTHLS